MPSKSDKEFGAIAVRRSLLTPEQVEECLSIQKDLETSGSSTTLDRVLLARAVLTPEQVEQVQVEQKRRVIFCSCGTRVNVFKYPPGKRLYCRNCKEPIIVPERADLEGRIYTPPALDEDLLDPDAQLPLSPPPPNVEQVLEETIGEQVVPPAIVGNLRVGEKIGEGGMGAVFRAHNLLLEREEAIKILKPIFATDPLYREKFLREARIAAKLKHPNITQVFDVIDRDGVLGYTMELISGRALSAILAASGSLPETDVVRILGQLASALLCIFEGGIVHRDIKPGNVLLDGRGNAVLTDLGLAKTVHTAGKSGLTSEGATLGTPAYMAPELIQSARYADIRADIYSLGALAYHCLAGRPPFDGNNIYEFLTAVLKEKPVPVGKRNDAVSPALSRLVMKMMKKDRASRFQTPDELLTALEALDG